MAESEQPSAPRRSRPPLRTAPPALGAALQAAINNWQLADASAIKAMHAGTASPEQQKRALDWILKVPCGLPDWPYTPGNHDETNLNLGRQFVGHQIMKLLKVDLSTVRRTNPHADEHSE